MLAKEGATPRKLFDLAIKVDMRIRHLAAALGGKDEHRADAAVDVDHVVRLGGTRGKGQIVKRLFVFAQVRRQRLEHARAVMEGHGAQGRPAGLARVVQHRLHVERGVARAAQRLARHRVFDHPGIGIRGDPCTGGKAFHIEKAHIVSFPGQGAQWPSPPI